VVINDTRVDLSVLFDIVVLVHGYEEDKFVSCFSKWYLLLPLDVKLFL